MTVRTNSGAWSGIERGDLVTAAGLVGHVDLVQPVEGAVDGGVVPPHDLVAAPAVGLLDRRLDPGDRLVARQDT